MIGLFNCPTTDSNNIILLLDTLGYTILLLDKGKIGSNEPIGFEEM